MALIICKYHNDSSHNTKQYFAAKRDRLNSRITKLLHGLYFINTFQDRNLYISAFKMLLIPDRQTCLTLLSQLRENTSLKCLIT